MHDPGLVVIGWHLVAQPCLYRLPGRRIGGDGAFVTIDPAADLPLYITFRLAQVAEATGLVVDVVQVDELVDEALAQRSGLRGREIQFGRNILAQDDAAHPLHDVELGADERFVGAVGVGLRAIRKTGVELVEDAVLTPHVMSRFRLVAERRAAQDELALGVFQQIGQIGRAAGKLGNPRNPFKARNLRLQILIDDVERQLFAFANAAGLIC